MVNKSKYLIICSIFVLLLIGSFILINNNSSEASKPNYYGSAELGLIKIVGEKSSISAGDEKIELYAFINNINYPIIKDAFGRFWILT